MITQQSLISIFNKIKSANFCKDLIWLTNEYKFQTVLKDVDNRYSVLASPFCKFFLFVDTENNEISYISHELLETLINNISDTTFKEFFSAIHGGI
ncbi:MAG TPA: hypothetical protein ENI33_03920 [Thermoplasmatales archaeon]|nr:hypothetical protein [Thermoplasmatales archaeon]